jgi:hypothetical protein
MGGARSSAGVLDTSGERGEFVRRRLVWAAPVRCSPTSTWLRAPALRWPRPWTFRSHPSAGRSANGLGYKAAATALGDRSLPSRSRWRTAPLRTPAPSRLHRARFRGCSSARRYLGVITAAALRLPRPEHGVAGYGFERFGKGFAAVEESALGLRLLLDYGRHANLAGAGEPPAYTWFRASTKSGPV